MEEEHVDTKKLFFIAAGEQKLSPKETLHLRMCEECQELRKMFHGLDSLYLREESSPWVHKKSVNF